jgi:hypothetical protein
MKLLSHTKAVLFSFHAEADSVSGWEKKFEKY